MEPVWAIGLMSGTSMDGVDAALIRTDGVRVLEHGDSISFSYDPAFRDRFRQYLGHRDAPAEIVDEFTDLNAEAARQLLRISGIAAQDVRVVGFHGQTLFHDAPAGITIQVGNGDRLAELLQLDVVSDFRTNDVAAGGQGAPFAPLYHQALSQDLEMPLVVLNLGGVANVTYLDGDQILAFDTGPASALLDDWMNEKTGLPYDREGAFSRGGQVDELALRKLLDHPYFAKTPPKSLDRDDFSKDAMAHLSAADGAATLSAFTICSIAKALDHMPKTPLRWLVTGGGRHNSFFMEKISEMVGVQLEPVEAVGWKGDELEAEAFAFLAVRSLYGMPLSLPGTTGVSKPMTGGVTHKYRAA
ncbi:anhydro-N-acetylmuramic acid kinase [Sneathiella limimaris]|uniref:anhydro-N-acetylmuramic acid kinase n=1 Tax=Sneathiella limimaris TaxID=1964213 RepID=UPI00146DFDEC|nr:anhydro-N-acetylmuramic acid kinase [Sneathiella limimaris]